MLLNIQLFVLGAIIPLAFFSYYVVGGLPVLWPTTKLSYAVEFNMVLFVR